MQDFRKLRLIEPVRSLIKQTYRTTESFPRSEQFGLVAQMRRAVVAIGSNIAEGCGRSSNSAFRVSLDRAMGESCELEFQCIVSQDLEFGDRSEVDRLINSTVQVKKMLSRLIVVVRRRHAGDEEGRSRNPES